MPYVAHGRTLPLDAPFELDGIRYPANWLRLSTELDREAAGISWEADPPPPPDQRFYWGYDEDGNPIPKDHADLVTLWTQQTRTTAGTLLTPTDWMVVRELDNGTPVPDAWKTWRQDVRLASEVKVSAIEATTTTEELAAYITGTDYSIWPSDPAAPAPEPAPSDGLGAPSDGVSGDLGLS